MFYTVVGTYSHVLYGYVVQKAAHDDQELEMKIIFIYKAHSACIRRLVAHNTLLLSGSDDEAIKYGDPLFPSLPIALLFGGIDPVPFY